MDPQRDLPRISVDSLQLWLHIELQYTNVHLALLDARCTQQDRDLCILHIHQYIDSLFAMAKPNLRVNGRNFEHLHENDQGTLNTRLVESTLTRR
jgi:hypothetical protein